MKLPRAAIDAAPRNLRRFVLRYVLPYSVSQRFQNRRAKEALARRSAYTGNALKLEKKLWAGFSEQAARELELLKLHPTSSAKDVFEAALALGCWQASRGDFDAAHRNAVLARVVCPPGAKDLRQVLLEAQGLMALGESSLARDILSASLERHPDNSNLTLCLANTYANSDGPGTESDEATRLEVLNRLFEVHGVARLARRDPSQPLHLDNLCAPSAVARVPAEEQPKVTVLMPAYCCVETLHIAMESLLGQTWSNIEIIVIDDKSSDGTFELACDYCKRDPRVVALQVEANGGAYAARNFGLGRATGTLVTVHDADDWSHPQQIEYQARHLMDHPELPANISDWVRCREHLYFRGPPRFSEEWVTRNASSFMVRSDVLRQARGWDEVRVGADNELIRRVEHAGGQRTPKVLPDVPLAFALDRANSLTRESRTHVNTTRHGVRRTYHDAARFWLSKQEPGLHPNPSSTAERAFPAPGFILKEPVEHSFDLLIVMDFYQGEEHLASALNYIGAALSLGLRVAVFHWARYELKGKRRMQAEVRELVHEGRVYRVSPGERLAADTVLVLNPPIAEHGIDLPPEIRCKHFAIIADEMEARPRKRRVPYDPKHISNRIEGLFGKRPVWLPVSNLTRRLMERDGRYERVHQGTWLPLIDCSSWSQTTVAFRGAERSRLNLGTIAQDHPTRWPSTAEAIRGAFVVGRPCNVELLGSVNVPTKILGGMPDNWKVIPVDSIDARDFFRNQDFFVHYPREGYVDTFQRSILEAMACGLPTVLPPVFESTFGDAALYAPPPEVWRQITSVWADERTWTQHSEAGTRFVREHCDWRELGPRLSSLADLDDA